MYNLTIDEVSFCIIDLETTSLSPETGEIIEIAAIKYEGSIITEKFNTLIKPSTHYIPENITKLTGITTAMIIDQPKIEEIFDQFIDFVNDTVLVAHNAKFDLAFLNHVSNQLYGKNIKLPVVCTCNLARRLFPETKSKSLSNLAYHFNIPFKQRHRAMSDALVTLEIFKKMLELFQDFNVTKMADIIKLSQNKPIKHQYKRRRYV
ncbi:MAG: 3'-5' exonuclease [Aquificae bacterium]|nr:3'-5' exonuclease [Aquificota bacterium]